MSAYLLYGEKIVKNDNTLKDFACSIVSGCPYELLEKSKDEALEVMEQILLDDISRTDINYEFLMHKYRAELGNLLYEVDNHGKTIPKLSFFGDVSKDTFEEILMNYLDINYFEIINSLKKQSE